jgi:RNA polymerase sigma-70 factor (ECF subfamily)
LRDPILPRISRGDSGAVDECLDRYGGLVWSLCCRLAPTDAEDAAQEIFIDLWRNAWRFRDTAGSEATFVSTIARRRLVDRRRRAVRAPQATPLEAIEPARVGKSPAAELAAQEDLERVRRCLGSLKDRDREAVELAVYDGLSQSEIAKRLSAPLGTVKSLIRRALVRLRDCMGVNVRPALEGGAE